MEREEYLRRWSAGHGDVAVDRPGLVRGWLVLVHALARPLVSARVPPDAVTLSGLAVQGGIVAAAAAGGRWVLLAVPLAVLAGVVDGLDGAVAVMRERTSRWGQVLDGAVDRIGDGAFAAALWLAGAPPAIAVAGWGLALLHEYVRARATAAGMDEVGVVTVSERPTRVVVTTAFLLGAGLYPAAAGAWSTAGAAALAGAGLVGLAQLLVAVRRRLR